MKLLITSDIHGSIYYAKKVIEAYHLHNCDTILLLGDVLYHGPRNPLPKEYNPKEVIPLLNTYKEHIIAVRGNCDAEVDQMVLDFPIMQDYVTIPYLNCTLYASHGHIYHPDQLPNMKDNDVFLYGHVHVPTMYKQNNVHIINPGSITLPKEDSHHSYMKLENNTFTLYDDTHHILQTYTI